MAYSIYSKAGTDEAISSALADSLPTTPADIGAATAAQGTKADTASQPGHTHTRDDVSDSATRLAMTAAERAKLSASDAHTVAMYAAGTGTARSRRAGRR